MLQGVLMKLGYLQSMGSSLCNFVPKSGFNFAVACRRSVTEIYSDSGQSAVDSSAPGGDRLASVVSAA